MNTTLIILAALAVIVTGYNLAHWSDRDIDAALADETERLAQSLDYLSKERD